MTGEQKGLQREKPAAAQSVLYEGKVRKLFGRKHGYAARKCPSSLHLQVFPQIQINSSSLQPFRRQNQHKQTS